jgi:hypothetical protein
MLDRVLVWDRNMKCEPQAGFSLHLALGTISFTLCFAAWG